MKKYIGLIAFLIVGIAIIIYTIPKSIIREYDGFIYGYEDEKVEGHVKVLLDGKLYPKIFGDNVFKGQIKINNQEINISTPLPGSLKVLLHEMKYKAKGQAIFTVSSRSENDYTRTQGTFYITRDFKYLMGVTDQLREEYNSVHAVIVCPATNKQEAEKILRDKESWGY